MINPYNQKSPPLVSPSGTGIALSLVDSNKNHDANQHTPGQPVFVTFDHQLPLVADGTNSSVFPSVDVLMDLVDALGDGNGNCARKIMWDQVLSTPNHQSDPRKGLHHSVHALYKTVFTTMCYTDAIWLRKNLRWIINFDLLVHFDIDPRKFRNADVRSSMSAYLTADNPTPQAPPTVIIHHIVDQDPNQLSPTFDGGLNALVARFAGAPTTNSTY